MLGQERGLFRRASDGRPRMCQGELIMIIVPSTVATRSNTAKPATLTAASRLAVAGIATTSGIAAAYCTVTGRGICVSVSQGGGNVALCCHTDGQTVGLAAGKGQVNAGEPRRIHRCSCSCWIGNPAVRIANW